MELKAAGTWLRPVSGSEPFAGCGVSAKEGSDSNRPQVVAGQLPLHVGLSMECLHEEAAAGIPWSERESA